uniref:Insulin like growth factor 1 n=1 Tax=Meleagris gallopavo TaxID=9103 RepID=A0A8I3B1Y0_MELGA
MEKINSLSTQLVKCCFCDFLKVKMHTVSYIHFFYLALCLLTLTSSAAAGPETLCGAELVDALQFVCGDRGFYFSKTACIYYVRLFINSLSTHCIILKTHKSSTSGWKKRKSWKAAIRKVLHPSIHMLHKLSTGEGKCFHGEIIKNISSTDNR